MPKAKHEHVDPALGNSLNSLKLLVAVVLVTLVALATYFAFFHDTWDIDNSSEISARSKAVIKAASEDNHPETARLHRELMDFIGDNEIHHDFIGEMIQDAIDAQSRVQELASQKVLADQAGFDAYNKGIPITKAPKQLKGVWIKAWKYARAVHREKQAEAERKEAKKRKLQSMKEAWYAGEAKAREKDGYYSSRQYDYDAETLQQFRLQLKELPKGGGVEALQLALIIGLGHKMEQDKYHSMSDHLRQYGVNNEAQWLELVELSSRLRWTKD
ncbi:hypothetical protein [Adhaeretor mobilis]|uniref:Uncharacterized protein n=1 Tax=Adhaeretor mobilis TaxID=1930276 RepID=A0A517MS33_9BACT|nr:hypothetical protein [Adhaeretor mobilis]QDS97692.1 hypothetical protein HG15A2_09560 [Adhaeretor mobilis]